MLSPKPYTYSDLSQEPGSVGSLRWTEQALYKISLAEEVCAHFLVRFSRSSLALLVLPSLVAVVLSLANTADRGELGRDWLGSGVWPDDRDASFFLIFFFAPRSHRASHS